MEPRQCDNRSSDCVLQFLFLSEVLQWRAQTTPDHVLYTLLSSRVTTHTPPQITGDQPPNCAAANPCLHKLQHTDDKLY